MPFCKSLPQFFFKKKISGNAGKMDMPDDLNRKFSLYLLTQLLVSRRFTVNRVPFSHCTISGECVAVVAEASIERVRKEFRKRTFFFKKKER